MISKSFLTRTISKSFLRKARGFGNKAKNFEHELVCVKVIIGIREKFLSREDGVGTREEAEGLFGHGEAHPPCRKPHHCLWHHDACRCDHPDHLPDVHWLKPNLMLLNPIKV